jgi:hypothetical protein
MATVTETFRRTQNSGTTEWPAAAKSRLAAAIASGAIVSHTVTHITDPAEVIPGKDQMDVTIVWRSTEDRQNFRNDWHADPILQDYLASSKWANTNQTLT